MPFELLPPLPPPVVTSLPQDHSKTILFNAATPTLIIYLPTPRVGSPKPLSATHTMPGRGMQGFLVPALSHFWPMWENAGVNVHDAIGAPDPGLLTVSGSASITWSAGENGVCLAAANLVAGSDVVITPIVLSGSSSIDYLAQIAGIWSHYLITNDPVLGLSSYVNGLLTANTAYVPSLTVSGLFGFAGIANGSLEYFRIWRRVLNLVEIQTLAADPYCMFGITQETLAEVQAIINFMMPSKEAWYFVYTG